MRWNFSRRLLASTAVSLALLFGICVVPAWGQLATQGSVAVTVLDPTNATIPDAELTLQDLATNRVHTGRTSIQGTYTFTGVSFGTYKLTITKDNFQTQVFDSVVVQAIRTTDIRSMLQVGATAQQVVVSETAVPIVETSSNAISATIDLKHIESLPMTGRDIAQLAYYLPGVASTGGSRTWNGLPLVATGSNIDGVQANTNRMKFSGNTTPIVEARIENMAEMTVQTDQLDLNTGFGTTAMQINFSTRRGTNALHGRIFWDHRNAALNAASWSNNARGIEGKPPFILNDFGGSAGGAIIRDKLFFFGSFSMQRQPGSGSTTRDILTSDAQMGILNYFDSAGNPQQMDLLALAAANSLPSTINPITAQMLSEINGILSEGTVSPTSSPNENELQWFYDSPHKAYFPAFRVDYNISNSVRLNVNWNNTRTSDPFTSSPIFPGAAFDDTKASNQSNRYTAGVGVDWNVTPTIINQFRVGFLYNSFEYGYDTNVQRIVDNPEINWGIGTSTFDFFRTGVDTYYPLWNVADNVTMIKGAHTINFGFSGYREQDHYWNPQEAEHLDIGLNCPEDPACTVIDNAFAGQPNEWRNEARALYAVLVGRIAEDSGTFALNPDTGQYYSVRGTSYNLNELQKGWGLFLQDSWRVSPSLTLNYGLRWDFTYANQDLTGGYHSADIEGIYGPTCVGCVFQPGAATLTGNPNPAYVARAKAFDDWFVSPQPAFGFAWNPTYSDGFLGKLLGGGNTVIRASAAFRNVTPPYQYFWNAASNAGYAFYQTYSLSPVFPGDPTPTGTFEAGTLHLGDALPAFKLSPSMYQDVIPQSEETFFGYWSGVNGILDDIQQPYVMSWNLGIQRSFGTSNVLEVRYLGNRSVHQWIGQTPNEINVFENGFLAEFQQAQANLTANRGQAVPVESFANNGLAGQAALPIMETAGVDMASGTFINYLDNGRAGNFAQSVTQSPGLLCNLVGSVNFSPCDDYVGVGVAGAYPLNFFQVNPFNSGKGSGLMTDAGWGNYHALQVDFRQKAWHGMQFDVNWTWAHTLGVQPGNSWTGGFNNFTLRDIRLSYGPTLFDIRHTFHANGTYDLPFGKGRTFANMGGVVDKVIGGWTVGTLVTWQTGTPFALQAGGNYNTFNGPTDSLITGRYGDAGVVLNGVTLEQLQDSVGVYPVTNEGVRTFVNIFDPQYLTSVTNGTPTGIGPNTTAGTFGSHPWLWGPRRFFQDIAITKAIPITERWRFSLQGQFLNVWNHPVWGSSTGNVQSSGFAHAGNVSNRGINSRQIEFRANIEF